jgi:ABC-type Co2+ transport system permease subunit
MAPAKLFGLILIQPKLLGPKTIIVCVLVYAVQIATGKKSSKKKQNERTFPQTARR